MRFSEVVDSPESAREFIEMNKITPREIIIVWDEDVYEEADKYEERN